MSDLAPNSIGCGNTSQPAILECKVQSQNIKDHEGNDVKIVWYRKFDDYGPLDKVPPFPYQVYLTGTAAKVVEDPNFPAAFACAIERIGGIPGHYSHYRFELYLTTFSNILGCCAHQRREVQHRNRNGIVPRLLSSWTMGMAEDGPSYHGRIIVIDTKDWADAGVILVSFDPAEYDRSYRFPLWYRAGSGDYDTVQAFRCSFGIRMIQNLHGWWEAAGCTWAQADLNRRNDGGFSPVLYPAVDPAAHYDAEHEETHELDGLALPGPANQADSNENSDDDFPRVVDNFEISELLKTESELTQFQTETYSDSFGFPVTGVWSSENSKARPSFSITLYMAFDAPDIRSKALFGCLNQGLISQEPWILDVINNMPSLDAALQYHTRASAHRTPGRVPQTKQCMQMILEKVAGCRLPVELRECIEDLLVPPEIPRYSSRPYRLFDNMFLYLDRNHTSTGPLLVYSNPENFWPGDVPCPAPSEPRRASSENHRNSAFERDLLRVVFLRFWNRVADEIHILWSMCSPRCSPYENPTPRVVLNITMPATCVWRDRAVRPDYVDGDADIEVTLQSDQPITVHRHNMFSHDIWTEAVDVVDVDSGDVLPTVPYKLHPYYCCSPQYCDSWAQSLELGFDCPDHRGSYDHRRFLLLRTFQPGNSGKLGLGPANSFFNDRFDRGLLQDGHEYALRLKPGVTVSRWTYGTVDALHGPYNLSPIPITMDHEPRFKFESRPRFYGSFSFVEA